MRRECTIKASKIGDDSVKIEILGDLTASAEKDMDSAYQEAMKYEPSNIILKFDGKSRINSAGIAILINLVIESQEKENKVYIAGVSQHFRKIFELVGLAKYTTIVESEEEVAKL